MLNTHHHIVAGHLPIREAIKRLNELGKYLTLFVVDEENKLVGSITDGDIRRGIVKGLDLSDTVDKLMFKKFRFLQRNNYKISMIKELKEKEIDLVPIVDEEFRIISIINLTDNYSILPVDAVIMAGGKGERLRPLTEKVPKPMLKVGEKPIIEHNIDRLLKFGVDHIHITLRYLAEQIIDYFGDGSGKNASISYVIEEEPMGTIASLKLVKNFNHDSILLMNSDLLTTIDLEDFYKQFEEDNAVLSIASIPYHVNIPYAVLELEKNRVQSLQEKPTYTYYSNAGIYLMKKEIIDLIPANKHYDATDLTQLLIDSGKKVTSYPIRGYWLDIGKHEDFKKAQEDIQHLKL